MLTSKEIKLGRQSVENQDFFSTPEMANSIANDIAAMHSEAHISILEPSVGTGTLIWPLLENVKCTVSVLDIEEDYLQYVAAEAKTRGYSVSVVNGLLTISN